MKRCLAALPLLVLLCARPSLAEPAADDYPNAPIQLVVPSGTGGITDALARALAQKLSPILHASIVVQDRPGASGIIGTSYAARAKPDGYTILLGPPSHEVNPNTTKNLPYDTVKDFAPISKIAALSEVLLVNADSPIKTTQDLIRAAQAHPNSVTYGSSGVGSYGDFCTLIFQSEAKIRLQHIPYTSEPAVMAALVRGDIQTAFISPAAALGLINGGKIRALATSTPEPLSALPGVPSVTAVLPGFKASAWNALFAPANTPEPIITKLNQAVAVALKDPDLIKFIDSQGLTPAPSSPQALQADLEAAIASIGQALRAAGIQPT